MKANKIGFSGTYYGEFNSMAKAGRFKKYVDATSLNKVTSAIKQWGPVFQVKVKTPFPQNSQLDKELLGNATQYSLGVKGGKLSVERHFEKLINKVI